MNLLALCNSVHLFESQFKEALVVHACKTKFGPSLGLPCLWNRIMLAIPSWLLTELLCMVPSKHAVNSWMGAPWSYNFHSRIPGSQPCSEIPWCNNHESPPKIPGHEQVCFLCPTRCAGRRWTLSPTQQSQLPTQLHTEGPSRRPR